MDDKGIIPDELEKVIEANKDYKPRELTDSKPYWGILYVLANYQNPRGMCLPPGQWAQNSTQQKVDYSTLCRSLQKVD